MNIFVCGNDDEFEMKTLLESFFAFAIKPNITRFCYLVVTAVLRTRDTN